MLDIQGSMTHGTVLNSFNCGKTLKTAYSFLCMIFFFLLFLGYNGDHRTLSLRSCELDPAYALY